MREFWYWGRRIFGQKSIRQIRDWRTKLLRGVSERVQNTAAGLILNYLYILFPPKAKFPLLGKLLGRDLVL